MFYLAIFFVIIGTISYDLLEKTLPKKVNSYLYLMFTYMIATLALVVLLFITKYDFRNLKNDINIQSVLVGISAMFVDFGLILAYRNGWKISTLNISYTISVLIILMIIDVLFLNKTISITQSIGTILCLISIVLMNIQNKKMKKR